MQPEWGKRAPLVWFHSGTVDTGSAGIGDAVYEKLAVELGGVILSVYGLGSNLLEFGQPDRGISNDSCKAFNFKIVRTDRRLRQPIGTWQSWKKAGKSEEVGEKSGKRLVNSFTEFQRT